MEFGKLANVDDVDWQIPEDDQTSVDFLKRQGGISAGLQNDLQIRFGAPAWGRKEWIGRIYPEGTKPADFLEAYARYFSCIELNTSHYRIPTSETVAKWRSQVTGEFQFCAKVYQGISHERRGLQDRALLKGWLEFVDQLGENAGPSFLQLPPHFDYSMKAELFSFLKNWPGEKSLALEFRHPSWFQQHRILKPLVEYLQSRGLGLVITDVAGRRDVLHTSISSDFTMLRFIGNNLHPSDHTRAAAWGERFRRWEAQGLRSLYLFIHEPDDVSTPEMTESFLQQLESLGGWDVRRAPMGRPASLQGRFL